MLITKLRPLHSVVDLTPVALFHTRRMSKMKAKLEAHQRLLDEQLAQKRAEERERKLARERQEQLNKLMREHPKEYYNYVQRQHISQLQQHQLATLRGGYY